MTLETLQGTKQRSGEHFMEHIKRFKDLALDCYDHYEEQTLVEMCMGNMIMEYRAVLGNLEISQFTQLLQKARKMAQSIRPSSDKPKEQKSTSQAMTVSTNQKRKKLEGREFESRPPILCTPKELDVLLDKWIADGIFKPNHVSRKSTKEERRDPQFCRLHNYVQHATAEYWALRRLMHRKIKGGTLELSQLEVQRNPLLNHKGKGVAVIVICADSDEDKEERLSLPATAITTLHRSSRFKNLFDQLELTANE